jgi:hypothetical protein
MQYLKYKDWLSKIKFRKYMKEVIKKYRKDPTLVVEEMFGIKFSWYQKLMFNSIGYFDLRLRNKSTIRIPKKN